MTNNDYIERLFKTHYEQMYHSAVALLHDNDIAQDIVHDVFVSLIDGQPDHIISSNYLLKAVRNRCLNHIRNCEIHQRIANRYFIDDIEYEINDHTDDETIIHIYRLIESELTSQAKKVIELRFSKGLPFIKIAAEMGISETAVYRHLRHALNIIRQKLNQNG